MGIIAWIVFGLIAGVIAKLVMPGRDGGGFILTCILGIVGAVVGGWLAPLWCFTIRPLKKQWNGSVHYNSSASCQFRCGERVKGVLRHALYNPGSRQGKPPLRGPLDLLRLAFGSGTTSHPCAAHPPPAPGGRSRPAANVPAVFSRTLRSFRLLHRLNRARV